MTAKAQLALAPSLTEILGFENVADWHVTSSPPVTIALSSTASEGAASLAVSARGFVTVQSATFSLAAALPSALSLDVLLPPPANPYWAGAVQLYLDCHSHNLFNQYIGQVELTGLPVGQFLTETFPVPAALVSALANGCSDLGFTVAINVPTNSTGNYLLDNMQLGGPATGVQCASTLGTFVDAGVTDSTLTFSNQLTRANLGTLTLQTTAVQADPLTISRTVSLNGSQLYSVLTQASTDGTSSTTVNVFPPIVGVHQLVATANATTVSLVIDGRQVVPQPVGAPFQLRFQDGQPPPTITAPPGLQAAVAELLANAASQIATCATIGAPAGASALLQAVGTDSGHASGDSGRACNSCEWGCYLGELKCAVTSPTHVVCGLVGALLGWVGALVCEVVVDTTVCTNEMLNCERNCSNAGTACCPVDCGGAHQVAPPIGLCCLTGETCLKRGSAGGILGGGAHVAICCSPGQTACGGNACCGSDTQCLPIVPGGAPSACCASGNISRSGTCCIFGPACTSNADCPSSSCGTDGCCTLG